MLRIRRENVVVNKHIKLNKMNEMILQKGENNDEKIGTIINVAYGILTYKAVLENINVIDSRVLPTEPLR